MTGFSADWLALREPADHQARNPALRDAAAMRFADKDQIDIVDLGCGTGSNLRALARYLPQQQVWRLVDNDPRLFAAARRALAAWAEHVESVEPLVLRTQGLRIEVRFHEADLAQLDGEALEGADLITAAALFDLVSHFWIDRFCGELMRRRLPLYAVLTYDGVERWSPLHATDGEMLLAFHRHQTRDKGFGPALGPRATEVLGRALEAEGYKVSTAPSPWLLSHGAHAGLIAALAEGAADAVLETSRVAPATVEGWRHARRSAAGVVIGHVDLLARLR
jgi:SAM-dependent methyltransferase